MYTINTLSACRVNYGTQRKKNDIKYFVVHYTANTGDMAVNNAKYFARESVYASAHYFIDEKEVWQSVPDDYIAYHVGSNKYYNACRNYNSLGFELCNSVDSVPGATMRRAMDLISDKMIEYGIYSDASLVRHYDVTRKKCPVYYVQHPQEWKEFKRGVQYLMFVKRLQICQNITLDGIAGNQTLGATVTISQTVNNRHPLVKIVQDYLNGIGYDCGYADGIAGPMFDRAVKKFQADNGCIVDGELTEMRKTWQKLLKLA